MFEKDILLEDEFIEEVDFRNYVKKLKPEIQQIFYQAYGEDLKSMPEAFTTIGISMEHLLECLSRRGTVRQQKLILMRLGVISGTPMTLQEVSNEFGITRERARQIERYILRTPSHLVRRKKLKDFLE